MHVVAAVPGACVPPPGTESQPLVPPVHAAHQLEGGHQSDRLRCQVRDSAPVPHTHSVSTQARPVSGWVEGVSMWVGGGMSGWEWVGECVGGWVGSE